MLGRSRLPSLAKEGWTRHQEISPFLLKARTGWFVQTPKQFLLDEPPRLRPFKVVSRNFLNGRSHPSFAKEWTWLQLPRSATTKWVYFNRSMSESFRFFLLPNLPLHHTSASRHPPGLGLSC